MEEYRKAPVDYLDDDVSYNSDDVSNQSDDVSYESVEEEKDPDPKSKIFVSFSHYEMIVQVECGIFCTVRIR